MLNQIRDFFASADPSDTVTWTMVLMGWLVINAQHNRRETRKEIRKSLDTLFENLKTLTDDSVKYHCSEERQKTLAEKIKRDIKSIIMTVASLGLLHHRDGRLCIELRSSITLDNFDTNSHQQFDTNDILVLDIFDAVDNLSKALEMAFDRKFRMPWWRRVWHWTRRSYKC